MSRKIALLIVSIAIWQSTLSTAQAQGLILSAAGPVNRSMGGASVAAPIDAIGATYWNPASISGMAQSELATGLDFLWINHSVSSSAGPVSGGSDGDIGTLPIPNVGWVHRIEDSDLTIGLGIHGVAGLKTTHQVNPNNPILNPPPNGLGRISSEAQFLQIAPMASLAVTDQLSVGFGPTITTGKIALEPFVFDALNANLQYSSGQATRYHWGLGGQVGLFYVHDEDLRFGASVKTPTWMETFEYYSQDENGNPRTLHQDFDLPLIVSLGASYAGCENWLFAADLRYLDYANTDGFGEPTNFDVATGELSGLNWSSVFALALGVQRTINDAVSVRAGYNYNQNPFSDKRSFFATPGPVIYQHTVSTGLSVAPTENVAINMAYSYMPENSLTGPWFTPGGAVPGTSVTNTVDAHFLSVGVSMRH